MLQQCHGWIRARILSLGLVAALGFLLIVSLVISAGLTAFGNYLDTVLPMGKLILPGLNLCCIDSAAGSALWRNL